MMLMKLCLCVGAMTLFDSLKFVELLWEDTKTMRVGAYGPISIIAIIVSVYNLKNKIKFRLSVDIEITRLP